MSHLQADAKAIFLEALDRKEPDELLHFLDQSCGTDLALRARVEELLCAHRDAGNFLGRPDQPEATVDERFGTVIGPYKLLEQIGEGGFGVVFMAEQQQPLRRKVALKVIKPGMDSKQIIARFEAERQALALMDHPNIARVLDAGTTDAGRPYFAMELVRGIPITQFCDNNQLSLRERLESFITVCQAVQHAHQKGIIHRDLKPSNVLVTLHDSRPLVKVIDFGIAKALGQERLTDKTLVTGLVQMLGTPLYMSPEQAEMTGQDADTRTDLYSLGVLLYELVTGTTPFDKERLKEASYDEIRRIIREEEPAKPSARIRTLGQAAVIVSANRKSEPKRLSQLFRRDLDWIVLKALEKDHNRRYETASSFAADVQRYLHDEPVLAYPPSAGYCLRKFARRNRAALVMLSGVAFAVLLAVVGLATSTVLIAREEQATATALRAETKAKDDLEQALERERELRKEERQNSYVQRIGLAEREWTANNLGRMEQLLEECPADLRGWEWHCLKRLRHKTLSPLPHDSFVLCVTFHPTGKYLASGSQDGIITVWDAHTGRTLRRFPVDETITQLVSGLTVTGLIASSLSYRPLLPAAAVIPGAAAKMVFGVAFSPDGQRLAAACSDRRVRIWHVPTGKKLLDWEAHRGPVHCVTFSPDGLLLASSCINYGWEGKQSDGDTGGTKVWDATTGQERFSFRGVVGVAFHPDGRCLASGSGDRTVKVWEIRTGRELWSSPQHTTAIATLAYSPNGRCLASASADYSKSGHGEIKLWDAQTGEPQLSLRGHIGFIMSVAFSPDASRLASAGMDKTIKLWDLATGRETLTLRGHGDFIRAVAFSPDGFQLASASEDRSVRIWDATPLEKKPGEEPLTLDVHRAGVLGVAFHPDGQRLATVADDAVKLWDSHTGKELFAFWDSERFWSIAFSPDGQRLAAGSLARRPIREVKVWDVRTGWEGADPYPRLTRFGNGVRHVAFSPDNRHVVSAHWDRRLRVWDTATWEQVREIQAHDYAILGLALSPDGNSAATCAADHAVKVWNVATGQLIVTLRPAHPGRPTSVAFRPDGRLLASASADGTIKLWNTQTWQQQGDDLRDPTEGVECLAFSPNGRLLAWGSTDATVKIWDALTKEIHSLRGHTSWVEDVAFSPDGKQIASASLDGKVKLWPVPSVPSPTGWK